MQKEMFFFTVDQIMLNNWPVLNYDMTVDNK